MTMNKDTAAWLHGLLSGFIGGFAGAVDSGLALIVIAPQTFNLGPALWKTLGTMTVLGVLTGLKVAFAYLKQSPVPSDFIEVTATQTKTTIVSTTPQENKP
jgi:hypothetical protein